MNTVMIETTMRMNAPYDTVKRSIAAKRGWVWRRRDVSPEELARTEARRRFAAALKAADPRHARLYICDVADGVQHYYQAFYPGDTLALEAIALARTMAGGTPPTEYWLRMMRRRIIDRAASCEDKTSPAYSALQAAGYTLATMITWAQWGLGWADGAADPAYRWELNFARHTPPLEALAR